MEVCFTNPKFCENPVEGDDAAAVLMQCVESNCAKSFPNSDNLQTKNLDYTRLDIHYSASLPNLVPAPTT